MTARYELRDIDAGSIVGTFASEAAALDEARGLLIVNGESYADDLSLGRRYVDGGELIAEGPELARLAEAASQKRRLA